MGLRGRGIPAGGLRQGSGGESRRRAEGRHPPPPPGGQRCRPGAAGGSASSRFHDQAGSKRPAARLPRQARLRAPAAASWPVPGAAGNTGSARAAEAETDLHAAGGGAPSGAPRCLRSPEARARSEGTALRRRRRRESGARGWQRPGGDGGRVRRHRPIRARRARAADLRPPARGPTSLLPGGPGSHLRRRARPQPRGQRRGEPAACLGSGRAGCGAEVKGTAAGHGPGPRLGLALGRRWAGPGPWGRRGWGGEGRAEQPWWESFLPWLFFPLRLPSVV